MTELRVPAAGRTCGRCGETMRPARSGSLRWWCNQCRVLSDRDPYLESLSDGSPMLPWMDDASTTDEVR